MAQGSGLTRGDRNRNDRIAALRAVVRRDRAVLAIDLGEDKQAADDARRKSPELLGGIPHSVGHQTT